MYKILCIEDEADLRLDICEEIRDSGYEVLEAGNGQEGLKLIRCERPDLVLCDIRMPVMDGYELLEIVRSDQGQWSSVPFIFLTAYGEREDILKGLKQGADDYLTKPVDFDLMLARVETSIRQTARVTKKIEQEQEGLQKELERAQAMQRDLVPCRETERVLEHAYNIRLTSHYESSTEIGGDMWGVQLISPEKLMIYIVDFSGHGVAAAMNTFRLHGKIDSDPIGERSPKEYLEFLNSWLKAQLQTGQYATVLLGIVDFERNAFDYAAAGATSPIRVDHDNKSIEVGSGKGLPLGLSANSSYEARSMVFNAGDALFLYSDALIEHGRKEGQDLGREGVENLVREVVDTPNHLIVDDILGPFLSQASRPISDDLTAICCVRK